MYRRKHCLHSWQGPLPQSSLPIRNALPLRLWKRWRQVAPLSIPPAFGSGTRDRQRQRLLVDPTTGSRSLPHCSAPGNKELRNSLAAAGKRTIERKFAIQDSVLQHIRFYENTVNRLKLVKPNTFSDDKNLAILYDRIKKDIHLPCWHSCLFLPSTRFR